jgi:predicted short-subunit dehydrogenase-like oxidoreductase (DUF2520 family)
MKILKRISIIGYGNVGKALTTFFLHKGVEIEQVLTRTPVIPLPNHDDSCMFITDYAKLKPVDLVLVCVSDNQINNVISLLPDNQIIAYTSGSVGLHDVQQKENICVFYPLQTFSSSNTPDLSKVPLLLEATDPILFTKLESFAKTLFNTVIQMDSLKREKLHIAAVFVNNFSNHLFHIAADFLAKNELDFNLLTPLIHETINKLETGSPFENQTGPARRNDELILKKHSSQLEGIQLDIYKTITLSIQKTYEKKL